MSKDYLKMINASRKFLEEAEAIGMFEEPPSKLEISESMFDEYTDAVIKAGQRLIVQDPKVMFLPIRGGSIHGEDVLFAAHEIANKRGIEIRGCAARVDCWGISHEPRVQKELRDYLIESKESVEGSNLTEEERKDLGAPLGLDDFTIIDTAYTGMAYSKILGTFREVFPRSKINGIVLKDKLFKSDFSPFFYAHEQTGGEFCLVETPLLFEDKNVVYHRLRGNWRHQIQIYTPDFLDAKRRIKETIERKVKYGSKMPLIEVYGNR